jgi:signal transduction histidine kinase
MRPNSLAFRLVAGAAIWSLVILVGGGLLLASAFRESVESSFDARTDVLLGGLIADAEIGPEGRLVLRRRFTQARFERPFSGLYWQVTSASDGQVLLRSRSIWDQELPIPEATDEPGPRRGQAIGPEGQTLRIVARDVTLPGASREFTFIVAGAVDDIERETEAFNGTIAFAVGILLVGLIGALLIQVRYGLRPLRSVEEGLTDIRSGRAERLTGELPSEIAPLADEMNKLLDHNAQIVERARTHVGNLAHALKTPLSVLTNEAGSPHSKQSVDAKVLSDTVRRQTDLMRRQVDHYLVRARAAASGSVLGARASVASVSDDLVRTLKRIHRDRDYHVTVDCPEDLDFRGERQDLEELLGNLLDNAFKWADGRICVHAKRVAEQVVITVEDDGPGLSEEERARVLKRGARLDESVPGSGLGLSIVEDVAGLYQGSFELDASPLGGVKARLSLPLAA